MNINQYGLASSRNNVSKQPPETLPPSDVVTLDERFESTQMRLNQSFHAASVRIDISTVEDANKLLQLSAIRSINEELEMITGEENSIELFSEQGLDISPEATADRIISLSTNFFESYYEQHTELSEEEARAQFIDVIGAGIDRGFEEAREILSGLSMLSGEIESNIDKTYDLVEEGLLEFSESGELN